MVDHESDDTGTWLVDLPPTSRQTWSALIVAAILVAGFAVLAPFAGTQLPRIDAFIPSLAAMIFVIDLITAILLFAQYSIYRSRALLALAGGYLFTALIVIPHALTFPGAFSPTGFLGADLQSAAWLYVFWHIGFPAALLTYAWLKNENRPRHNSASFAISRSVTVVFCLVCGLTWLAVAGDEFLPNILLDRTRFSSSGHFIALSILLFVIVIFAAALILLWAGRRSVLDQWLMVVALASISETILASMNTNVRFTVAFYGGRIFSLITSTIVLAVLLAETTRLYARLARSNVMLQHERNNRLMNLDATVASISHEVRQPLAAIAANSQAALRFLKRTPPVLEEVQSALNRTIDDSHRASKIFDNIRALFGNSEGEQEPVDVNDVILTALRALDGELKDYETVARIELASELPQIMGHRGQLQEVIINLVHNAIEAMNTIEDGRRVLQLRTERDGNDAIVAVVEDSGPGIDPEKLNNIFDAFVTTKARGIGLGLAICRMIIERHEGQLSVSRAHPRGSVFRIVLPIGKTGGA